MNIFVAMCVDRGAVEEEDMEAALEEEDMEVALSYSMVMEIAAPRLEKNVL